MRRSTIPHFHDGGEAPHADHAADLDSGENETSYAFQRDNCVLEAFNGIGQALDVTVIDIADDANDLRPASFSPSRVMGQRQKRKVRQRARKPPQGRRGAAQDNLCPQWRPRTSSRIALYSDAPLTTPYPQNALAFAVHCPESRCDHVADDGADGAFLGGGVGAVGVVAGGGAGPVAFAVAQLAQSADTFASTDEAV
jgi:hypothetical protein